MGPKAKTIINSILRDPEALNELRNALDMASASTMQTPNTFTTPPSSRFIDITRN
jgi:hypothetical protein